MLEPIAYACPVFTGPLIHNSPEAVELQREGLLTVIEDWNQFEKELTRLLRSPEERKRLSERSFEFLLARQGASDRYLEILSR